MSNRESLYISKEEIEKQMLFISEISNKWGSLKRRYFINTYGCQMNVHDSEKLQGMLSRMGYEPAESYMNADIIVFNTCCIREHAEAKVFGNVGALKDYKTTHPSTIICVCGCMMQQQDTASTLAKKFKHVDLVFGTHNLHKFPELLHKALEDNCQVVDIWNDDEGSIAEDVPVERKDGPLAWVNIMYGCNNYCSYCIVPYVRGRERSRDPKDIIKEVQGLSEHGYKEVTLLGQNINSYGLDSENMMPFAQLLKRVNDETDIERIRFMTSHPKDLSDELIDAMAKLDKVCKHIHLPVQAGSDAILNKMNRKYTTAHYIELAQKLRKAVPEIEITTDIIVGFPGETDEDFEMTKNFMKKVMFNGAYTFKYSPRKGTVAEKMTDQIPEQVKKQRLHELNDVMTEIVYDFLKSYIGTDQSVLVESFNSGVLMGKTSTARSVFFEGPQDLVGSIVNVKITGTRSFSLRGELIN